MSTLLLLARFLLSATLLLLARFLLSATLLAALLTTLLLLAGLLVRILILIHLTSSPTLVRSATQSRARLVAENNVQRVVLFQVQLELDVHRTCSLRIRGGPTMGRYLLLWLFGVPIPILTLIWLFGGLH